MKVYTRETQFIRRYLVTKEQLRAVQCFVIYSFCEFKVKMRIIMICNIAKVRSRVPPAVFFNFGTRGGRFENNPLALRFTKSSSSSSQFCPVLSCQRNSVAVMMNVHSSYVEEFMLCSDNVLSLASFHQGVCPLFIPK